MIGAEPIATEKASNGHRHGRASDSRRKLSLVLVLTAIYMVAEALGGWWTGSLALLADAGHMLTDVAALGLALMAVWFSSRPATSSKTFGYHRLEILAALVNGVALVVIALLIFYESYQRWASPPNVRGNIVILVATGGLIINLISAWILHGGHEIDLNIRGAWLHVISDALGSIGAIIAGAIMSVWGWYTADPLFSALIGLLIIWSSWRLIRESANVLLEGTPSAHQSRGCGRCHSGNSWSRCCSRFTHLDDHLRAGGVERPCDPPISGLSARTVARAANDFARSFWC